MASLNIAPNNQHWHTAIFTVEKDIKLLIYEESFAKNMRVKCLVTTSKNLVVNKIL